MPGKVVPPSLDQPAKIGPLDRLLGGLAALLVAGMLLGCMSLNIGGGPQTVEKPAEDGLIAQNGTVPLGGDEPQTVYYPIPYVSTPNLTLECEWPFVKWQLVEQKWDHFTVRRDPGTWGSPVK